MGPRESDFIAEAIEEWRAMENAPLDAVMAGATLCPNCKGKGHEGLGLLDSDFPCRRCWGQGTLETR